MLGLVVSALPLSPQWRQDGGCVCGESVHSEPLGPFFIEVDGMAEHKSDPKETKSDVMRVYFGDSLLSLPVNLYNLFSYVVE